MNAAGDQRADCPAVGSADREGTDRPDQTDRERRPRRVAQGRLAEESFEAAGVAQATIDQNRMAFGSAEFVVVLDPLDNTKGYAETDTVKYATVVAVLQRGVPIYYIAIAPEADERYEAYADARGVTFNGARVSAFGAPLAHPARLLAAGLYWVEPPDPLRTILPGMFHVTDRFGSFQLAIARMVRRDPALPSPDGALTAGAPYHETIPVAAILHLASAATVRANGLSFFPIQWSDLATRWPHQLVEVEALAVTADEAATMLPPNPSGKKHGDLDAVVGAPWVLRKLPSLGAIGVMFRADRLRGAPGHGDRRGRLRRAPGPGRPAPRRWEALRPHQLARGRRRASRPWPGSTCSSARPPARPTPRSSGARSWSPCTTPTWPLLAPPSARPHVGRADSPSRPRSCSPIAVLVAVAAADASSVIAVVDASHLRPVLEEFLEGGSIEGEPQL